MNRNFLDPMTMSSDQMETVRALHQLLQKEHSARLVGPDGASVELPDTIRRLLVEAVRKLEQGDAVSITPIPEELTIYQAAELLGVSHVFIEELLESNQLPSGSAGTLRRVRLIDLLAYKDQQKSLRLQALEELVRYDQELGL